MTKLKMRATECAVLSYFLALGLTLFMRTNPAYLTPWLAYTTALLGLVALLFIVITIRRKRQEAREKGKLLPWYRSSSFAIGMLFAITEGLTLTPTVRLILLPFKQVLFVTDIVFAVVFGSSFLIFAILGLLHRHAEDKL